jgi:hypothetical protein
MKRSELRQIIKEELQAVLREKEEEVELSSDEQKIFDDIIGEGLTEAEVDFKDVLSKVKRYAKKGVLTAAILAKLTSPTLGYTSDQIKDITQIANTEMSQDQQQSATISYKDLIKKAKKEGWQSVSGSIPLTMFVKKYDKNTNFKLITAVGQTEPTAWQSADATMAANKIQTLKAGKQKVKLANGNYQVIYIVPVASF